MEKIVYEDTRGKEEENLETSASEGCAQLLYGLLNAKRLSSSYQTDSTYTFTLTQPANQDTFLAHYVRVDTVIINL